MTKPGATQRMVAIIDFLQAASALKDTLRSGRTAKGRSESTAEHSWRLCLMIMSFGPDLVGHDVGRMLRLAIVHDLGEAINGDTPATQQDMDPGRADRERRDMVTLCAPLPEDMRAEMIDLWDDYAKAGSPEAKIVKGLDKLETMLQHVAGANEPDFDYGFNLTYGTAQTATHPLLREIRALVDAMTISRAEAAINN